MPTERGSQHETTLAAAVTLAAALTAGAAVAQKLVVGAYPSNPPWEFKTEQGQFQGFEVDMATETARRLGRAVDISDYGFQALFAATASQRPFRWLAIAWTDFFRALPILVLLILIYFALPFVGIRLSAFTSATLTLSLVFAAFTAEVFRAGIQAIPRGQIEAAAALGLPFPVTVWKVILPQAFRIAIPPHTSNAVAIAKDHRWPRSSPCPTS